MNCRNNNECLLISFSFFPDIVFVRSFYQPRPAFLSFGSSGRSWGKKTKTIHFNWSLVLGCFNFFLPEALITYANSLRKKIRLAPSKKGTRTFTAHSHYSFFSRVGLLDVLDFIFVVLMEHLTLTRPNKHVNNTVVTTRVVLQTETQAEQFHSGHTKVSLKGKICFFFPSPSSHDWGPRVHTVGQLI